MGDTLPSPRREEIPRRATPVMLVPLVVSAVLYASIVLLGPPRGPGGLLAAAVFVAQNLTLAFTALHIARRVGPLSFRETLMVFALVCIALPADVVPLLGALHALTLRDLVVTTGLVQTLLLVVVDRCCQDAPPRRLAPRIAGLALAEIVVLALAGAALVLAGLNTVRYTVTGTDEMYYHLPLAAEMVKTASIAPAESIAAVARAFPAARESVLAWLSLPMLSDNTALLMLFELPATFLAIYALCREVGAPRLSALSLATFWLTAPIVASQATLQKNDLFLALTAAMTMFFLLRCLRSGASRHAVLAGLAGGLLCATKYSGPAYLVVLLACFGVARLIHDRDGTLSPAGLPLGTMLRLVMIVGGVATATSCVWYVRNIVYLGNPVYPTQVVLFGRLLFDGPFDAAYAALNRFGPDLLKLLRFWRQFAAAFGTVGLLLTLAPLAVALSSSWRPREWRGNLWAVILPLALLLLYMEQPFSLHQRTAESFAIRARYMLPYFATLQVSAALLLARHRRLGAIAVAALFLGSVANLASWTHFWWLAAGASVVLAVIFRIVRGATPALRLPPWPHALSRVIVAIAVMGSVVATGWLDTFRERSRGHPARGYASEVDGWGPVCQYIRANVTDARILVLGSVERFPLYGRRFSNTLFAPGEYDAQDIEMRVFGVGRGVLAAPDASVLRSIDAHAIDYVVGFRPLVGRQGSTGEVFTFGPAPTEDLRARHPDRFEVVYARNGAEVLRIRRTVASPPAS